MNMTAIVITAIICLTIAYISTNGNNRKNESRSFEKNKDDSK